MAVKKINKTVWVDSVGTEFETERAALVNELGRNIAGLIEDHFEPSDSDDDNDDSGQFAENEVIDFIVENRTKLRKLFDEADKVASVKKK